MPLTDDLIAETTATTGTGTISLDGAQTGYQRFRDFHADGARVGYAIFVPGGAFERGVGRLTYGTPDTITRDHVLVSSNGDTNLVNFVAGTKQATGSFQTAVASRLTPLGAVRVHRNGTNQTITSGVSTKVQHTTEDWDDDGWFDAATNHRYQPTLPGLYQVAAQAHITDPTSGSIIVSALKLNGTTFRHHVNVAASATGRAALTQAQVRLDGDSDYVEHFAQANGGATHAISGASVNTYFEAFLISL